MCPFSRHRKHDLDDITVFLFAANSRLSNFSHALIWWLAPHAAHPVVLGDALVDFGADDVVVVAVAAATFATWVPPFAVWPEMPAIDL